MEFFYFIKATQKSGKEDAVIWFTSKTEARANLQLDVELEDADIETGRGKDYIKPVRTDFPVYDDLPEESTVDYSWCKRYELDDDQRTWKIKQQTEKAPEDTSKLTENTNNDSSGANTPVLTTVATMSLRQRILAQFITDEYTYHIDADQKKIIQQLEMDMDNSYVQNMLLAAENVEPFKSATEYEISKVVDGLKTIFPADGKRTELSVVLQFFKAWFGAEHIDRGLIVKEWSKGNRISEINRTPSGANAGGGNKTDRLTTLTKTGRDYELAMGLLARRYEFDIYSPSLEIDVKANAIMNLNWSGEDDVLDEFLATSKLFDEMPGGMDYSRACNVATVKTTPENLWKDPTKHLEYLNRVMTEIDHAHPDQNLVDIACGRSSMPVPMLDVEQLSTDGADLQPNITHEEDALNQTDSSNQKSSEQIPEAETTSNVQMEETGNDETKNSSPLSEGQEEIVTGGSAPEDDSNATAIDIDSGHHNNDIIAMLYTHLMVDIESMGKKTNAPIVSIGAVFFDPASGQTGPEFYKVISLESAMEWGGVPDASTILFWLKATPEARSEIVMDDAIPLDDALLQFTDFIAENAANGNNSVQVWGNGATFDNVLLEESYDRTGIPCPWKFFNNRDVRTIVELGKAVGYTPRYEIPFEGEPHKAISDALHQVKYVSAIWQRLTSN